MKTDIGQFQYGTESFFMLFDHSIRCNSLLDNQVTLAYHFGLITIFFDPMSNNFVVVLVVVVFHFLYITCFFLFCFFFFFAKATSFPGLFRTLSGGKVLGSRLLQGSYRLFRLFPLLQRELFSPRNAPTSVYYFVFIVAAII